MKRLLPAVLSVSLLGADNFSMGELPFDWSGHWGVIQRYGFSGWGVQSQATPLHFDGNFAHWLVRYRFPFASEEEWQEADADLRTTLWYRTGDYGLDELSFDIRARSGQNRRSRFRALKKNFEDYHGLLDPANMPGGTIQQNYRFDYTTGDDKDGQWRLASALYLTTDAVPYKTQNLWVKGADRRDRIVQNGLSYSGTRGSIKYRVDGSSFLQRVKSQEIMEGVSGWDADLISHRLHAIGKTSLRKGFALFLSATGGMSAMSSDTLGNQRLSHMAFTGGVRGRASGFEHRGGLGISVSSPGEVAANFHGHLRLKRNNGTFFLDVKHDLQPLPFQFTGRPFKFVPDFFTPALVPRVRPNSTATVPTRTVVRAGGGWRWGRAAGEALFFASQETPHHYFERIVQPEGLETFSLTTLQVSQISGLHWSGRINYFREWDLSAKGVSLFGGEAGWENLFNHQGEVGLRFRESLFDGRMDTRFNLILNVWDGRSSYDWDPILNLGYSDTEPRDAQNSVGIVTAEFKAVIQSLELSYVLTNLQYAVEKAFGQSSSYTFSASPLFPPAARLAYFAVRWKLAD